jgi:hypothetical protein
LIKKICCLNVIDSTNITAYVDSTIEYGTGFSLSALKLDVSKNHNILFEGDFCTADELKDVFISGYAGHADVANYQQYYDLNTQVKEKGKGIRVQFLFNIEKMDQSDDIKVFIWNPGKKFVCYDNLRVRVY